MSNNVNTELNESVEGGVQQASFLQVEDVQKLLGISRASAYSLVKQKGFPHIRVGNRIVIPHDLFNEWVTKTAMSGRC